MKKKLSEKTISSESVYLGHYLKIQKDQVLLPDGKSAEREYILHPGAAMIIPLLKNGNVVLLKQYRHALKSIFIEFPAGKKDKNEKSLQTAQRELKEETGYESSDWRYLTTIHPVIGYADEAIDLYLAQNLTLGLANPDQGEFLEPFEISPDELIRKVRRGEVTDVKTQIGVFWLEKIIQCNW